MTAHQCEAEKRIIPKFEKYLIVLKCLNLATLAKFLRLIISFAPALLLQCWWQLKTTDTASLRSLSSLVIPVTRLAPAPSNFTDKSASVLSSPPWSTVVPARARFHSLLQGPST